MSNLPLLSFQVTNGIIWGLIVALLAVGLNLIYGLLNIVNVAQGAFYMVGAYLAWLAWSATGSFSLGVVLAPLLVGIAAVVLERTIIRPIEHDHDLTIIMTIGLSLVLEQGALALFGGEIRSISIPMTFTVPIFGFGYPGFRVVLAGIALAALFALWLFLNRTRYGLWIRAVRHNPKIAEAMGVPTEQIFAVTFGIGTGFAVLGGALASPIVTVRPEMGLDIIVIVFVVVIVGGLGNIFGSALIAVLIATVEGIALVYTNPTMARVISLVVTALIILRWPDGIISRRQYARR
jgi:branched-chain amino acid transport system permease protein